MVPVSEAVQQLEQIERHFFTSPIDLQALTAEQEELTEKISLFKRIVDLQHGLLIEKPLISRLFLRNLSTDKNACGAEDLQIQPLNQLTDQFSLQQRSYEELEESLSSYLTRFIASGI